MICAALALCVGCGTIQALFLGVDLLGSIARAPAGQKACAAFNVLNTQANGRSLSRLINAALGQTNSTVRFTAEEGDTLLQVVKIVNCEFISCFAEQVQAMDPPTDDASAAAWALARLELLRNIETGCPSPLTLTDDQKVQLVRLLVALDLS